MVHDMRVQGKRIKRKRIVRTDRFVVAVEVEAVIPDADPSEACYEPETVNLLREVQRRAEQGDREWLLRHGRVYELVQAA